MCCTRLQLLANDLEQRLASVSAELSTSRALEGRLQQRLAASVPAAQLEQMAECLQVCLLLHFMRACHGDDAECWPLLFTT